MRFRSLFPLKCFCISLGLISFCAYAEEPKPDPDALSIQKLVPSPNAHRTAQALLEYGKVFTIRFFNGQADSADLKRLLSVIRDNPRSTSLIALLVQTQCSKEQRNTVLPELVKIAGESDENYLIAFAASQMYLIDDKPEEALPLLRSAFRHAVAEKTFVPDPDETHNRLLVSIISSYLYLTEKTGHPEETDQTLTYLRSHPEWISRPDVAAELLLVTAARYNAKKKLLPTPIGFVHDHNYALMQETNQACDLLLAALQGHKGRLKLPQSPKIIRILSLFGKSEPTLHFLLDQLMERPQDKELLGLLSEFYAEQEQYYLAAHTCETALKLPNASNALRLRAYCFYRLADDLPNACRMMEDYLRNDPQNEWAQNELQALFVTMNDLPRALAFQRIKPLSYNRLYTEAIILFDMQQYDAAFRTLEAAELFLKAHKQKLKNPQMLLTMYALCAEKSGRLKSLEEITLRMLKELPNTPEILNFVGYIWADHEIRLPEALSYIERAVKAEPKNAAFLDSLAWALYRLKRYPEARAVMQKCLAESREKDSVILEHAGDIELKCGDIKRAVEFWNKALDAFGECNYPALLDKIRDYENKVK